jgi:TolA-binding protein
LGNEARRSGRSAEAISFYQVLQTEYPASSEALASHLPWGELLLRSGRAAEALSCFDKYQGSLMPEAMWGKARAYRQLGQKTNERRILMDLEAQYPNSGYSAAIEKRLGRKAESD